MSKLPIDLFRWVDSEADIHRRILRQGMHVVMNATTALDASMPSMVM